ncbi:MAG: ELM1/GtrOC1 family putative glycosyltransferase, partial [Opitutales bacterium]
MSKSNVDGSEFPLQVWRFTDGKPGHEKQTEGFLHALGERLSLETRSFAIGSGDGFRRFRHWLFGQFPAGKDYPDPDLLLGAGHRLHFAMLTARKARGGLAMVLMKPSLPLGWFDLSLIPQHDDPPDSDRVLPTCSALTTVRPSTDKEPKTGLLLIGGPSSHFDWSDAQVADRVAKVVAATEDEGV